MRLNPKQMLSFATHYGDKRETTSVKLPAKLIGDYRDRFVEEAEAALGCKKTASEILNQVGTDLLNERGKLHKRFCSAAHKLGKVVPDAKREALGVVVGEAIASSKEPVEIEFTSDIWWGDSDFSQKSSCWWGSERECAKDMLIDNGGFAMLEYKNRVVSETVRSRYTMRRVWVSVSLGQRDIYKVYDRTDPREETIALGSRDFADDTIGKLNLYTPTIVTKEYDDKFGRVWVMPQETDDGDKFFVLFNAYGRDLPAYAAILAGHLTALSGEEWTSEPCDLENNGGDSGKFYINGGKGYVVAPRAIIEDVPASIDFEIDEPDSGVYCHDTGEYMNEDDTSWCDYYEHTVSSTEEVIVGRRSGDYRYEYWSSTAVANHAVYCESDGNTYAREFAQEYLVQVDGDWYKEEDTVWSEYGDENLLERDAVLINALDSNETDWVSRYTANNECIEPENVSDSTESKLYFRDDERVTKIGKHGWYLIDGDGVVRVGDDYYVDGSDELEEVAIEIDSEWYAKEDCKWDELFERWQYVGFIPKNQLTISFTPELELA